MIRISAAVVVFVSLICFQVLSAIAAENNPPSVLIVYTVGQPSEKFGNFTREDLDAVTTATGVSHNTKTVASDLKQELESRGIQTTIVDALELKSHDIIFEHSVLVLGTPVRYAHIGWEMKKFIDEIMWRVRWLESREFAGWPVAVYTMAGGSGAPALDYIKLIMGFASTSVKAHGDFLATDGPTMKTKKIESLADQIVELLPEPPAGVSNYKVYDEK